MSALPEQALVLGAGVSGLSVATLLQERGVRTKIIAEHPPLETTSNKAAALWLPFHAGEDARISEWCRISYDRFAALHQRFRKQVGLALTTSTSVAASPLDQDPPWAEHVTDFRRFTQTILEAPYGEQGKTYHGFSFTTFMVQMPIYLKWLFQKFVDRGGIFEQREIDSLDDLSADHSHIINCTGLGSRDLAGDAAVYPIAGHITTVEHGHCKENLCPSFVVPEVKEYLDEISETSL